MCDNTADITQIFLNPLAAIISAAKGPRYEDTEPYEREENRQREKFIIKLQEEIDHLYHLKYPTLPTSYLEAYSTPSPIEITTKYPVHNPDKQWYKTYLILNISDPLNDNYEIDLLIDPLPLRSSKVLCPCRSPPRRSWRTGRCPGTRGYTLGGVFSS